ncbi:MAG: tail fiber protein [Acidobacteria bacterium]|jgi:microcystin-dependent protein|nr:tail fiber protein [Acidobacteriota bacterium]
MADPFIGEIRMWALNFAPYGWAFCNGQILPIAQNSALFAILGTTYGGDGKSNFALPNFQGRAPMHYGAGPGLTARALGESSGVTTVTLTSVNQLPTHNHYLMAQDTNANSATASQQFLAKSVVVTPRGTTPYSTYGPVNTMSPMANQCVETVGGQQAHNNMQPYLPINMCIALTGVFPPRG